MDREKDQDAALAELAPAYFQEDFDPVAAEMGRLPPHFNADLLDTLVDRQSWVLEVRCCAASPSLRTSPCSMIWLCLESFAVASTRRARAVY